MDTAALRKVCEEFSQAIHEPSEKEREQLRLLLKEYSQPTLMAAIQDAKGKGPVAGDITKEERHDQVYNSRGAPGERPSPGGTAEKWSVNELYTGQNSGL